MSLRISHKFISFLSNHFYELPIHSLCLVFKIESLFLVAILKLLSSLSAFDIAKMFTILHLYLCHSVHL